MLFSWKCGLNPWIEACIFFQSQRLTLVLYTLLLEIAHCEDGDCEEDARGDDNMCEGPEVMEGMCFDHYSSTYSVTSLQHPSTAEIHNTF